MLSASPMEIGLVFWAERDVETTLQQLGDLNIRAGQLGVPPGLHCALALDDWARGLNERRIAVTSAVCSYAGEDYANLDTIHKTVGFTNETLRAERVTRTGKVSAFAASLGIQALSCHIGFIPSDQAALLYRDLVDVTRQLCDLCGDRSQDFALETGQESATVLLQFIDDVERQNLKVNFDPANMIMYGSGDPVMALEILSPHVISVHCKDAHFPAEGTRGLLGEECAIGDGEVDFPAFLKTLTKMHYQGLLSIEREEPEPMKRMSDIEIAVLRLKQWKADLGL